MAVINQYKPCKLCEAFVGGTDSTNSTKRDIYYIDINNSVNNNTYNNVTIISSSYKRLVDEEFHRYYGEWLSKERFTIINIDYCYYR